VPEDRFDERTEPATPRRRQEARARGHVARSADLAAAVVLLGGVAALAVFGRSLAGGLFDFTRDALGNLAAATAEGDAPAVRLRAAFRAALAASLPVVAIPALAAAAASVAQVGFLWAWPAVAPDPARLDPAAGLGRIFSSRALLRAGAALAKVAAVAAVAGLTLWAERERVAALGARSAEELARAWSGATAVLALRAGLALLALGLADYAVARWLYERDLRMSRAERLEEQRRTEGDPRVKERRRALRRGFVAAAAPQGTLEGAAVLVVEPDRAAVALRYDPERDPAPVVAARATGRAAERLREAALEADVPVVERGVARTLCRKVEVGRPIPEGAFPEVAEILAFIVRLKGGAPAS
jgi:flagellar biosynthetic protein FlhB